MPAGGSADVSVRAARVADVAAMAEVQVATWRSAYAGVLPAAALDAMDAADVEAGWRASLEHAADPRARALVALEAGRVVGLTGVSPASDDDLDEATAEVGPLLVHPAMQGRGHGSRLLNAAVDYARDAGFSTAAAWVVAGDERLRHFLEAAGWAADGATRTLDVAGAPLREARLHTALRQP